MKTREEAKILLMNLFRDTKNTLMTKFILSAGSINPQAKLSSTGGWADPCGIAFHFPGHGLTVRWSRKKDYTTDADYNEVSICDFIADETQGGTIIKLNEPYRQSAEKFSLQLEESCFVLRRDYDYYAITDDFELVAGEFHEDYAKFDIVNQKTEYAQGTVTAAKTFSPEDLLLRGMYSFGTTNQKLCDDIEARRLVDPAFDKIAEECAFRRIMLPNLPLYWVVRTLVFYILNPSIKHVLSSERGRNILDEFAITGSTVESFQEYFHTGNSLWEVLGVPKALESYFDCDMKTDSMRRIRQELARLHFAEQFVSQLDSETVRKMASCIPDDAYSDTQWYRLFYLLNNGYTVDEITDYLFQNEQLEATEVYDGFNLLFCAFRQQAILTGKKEKIFPQYLSVYERVNARTLRPEFETILEDKESSFKNNLFGLRKELEFSDGGEITITGMTYELLARLTEKKRFNFLSCIEKGEDLLFWPKKKGFEPIVITVIGQAVFSVNEKLNAKQNAKLREWAAAHQLACSEKVKYVKM